tara:strand:- start:1931 stop:2323 length:393 start_codon:yes stop_codon:yes gene_type:complete
MSFYTNMFKPPKEGCRSYLWKINHHGEIVVELLCGDAEIVCSSRDMAVMSLSCIEETLTQMLEDQNLVVVSPLGLWRFGVNNLQELADKLNSKKSSEAKTLWNSIPYELQPTGIKYVMKTWCVVETDGSD